ncbi:MAG: 1-deoxy-D-xylulose-5-phosphate synthase [Clostridia bacterium]|nr:1-deoxy-D-xylulose-5-phosphate synthase [Clostridia bacterium]
MRLSDIRSPEDVKRARPEELEPLAEEIRRRILETVSRNGGHLASNLGMVELTIALHRVFDVPRDRLIFDVGHQCYAHKLLTGRGREFDSLRAFGGLAGFPRREESACDAFDTGHASTAISAAVGFARARDLLGEDRQVVAVVGDGALTGGMCYEALNNAGSAKLRMIVVLNDNGMSISRNVGAVSGYLTHLRVSKGWVSAKQAVSKGLLRLPRVGKGAVRVFRRVKNGVRNIFVQDRLFSAFGFRYLGPVDGSDIAGLEKLFRSAKELNEPVFIHVVTQKGAGYGYAEDDPTRLHGTPPFDVETGLPLNPGEAGMGAAAGQEVLHLAKEDARIVAVTAAMTESTGFADFAEELPQRLFDVGIAEEHAVTMAAGLAAGGARPFVAIYDTFLQRGYDQILHDVCLQHLPVCFLIDRAGLSEDGATHHGVYGIAYLSQMPGMQVLCASSREQLRAMVRYALTQDGPVAIRYAKGGPEGEPVKSYSPAWQCLRKGENLALLACGTMVKHTLKAADLLEKQGMRCAVYEASRVCPLDEKALEALDAAPLVTVEEGVLAGGFGSAVCRFRAQRGASAPVLTLGVASPCATQGAREEQIRAQGLDAASIAARVIAWRKKA